MLSARAWQGLLSEPYPVEVVLVQASSDDEALKEWTKQEGVMIETIPPEVKALGTMSGWRDPIVFETPNSSDTGYAGLCADEQTLLFQPRSVC